MKLAALAKRNVALACLYYVYDGFRRRRRLRRGILATRSGMRHLGLDTDRSLEYVAGVWADYLAYSGRHAITGKVIEIGPGDNFGVALHCLKQGASKVVAIDKFFPERDPVQQSAIYKAMVQRHDMADLFDGTPGETTIRGLEYRPGVAAEAFFTGENAGYDAVISRAVLEHLDDPLQALDAMWQGLRPGGILVHRIDLRDHGMFPDHHPLTYLTLPVWLYRLIAAETGRPNRVLLPAYRSFLAARGWPVRLGVTRLVGVPGEFAALGWDALPAAARRTALAHVQAIRPRLAAPFSALHDEDLAVAGFVLTAEKGGDIIAAA